MNGSRKYDGFLPGAVAIEAYGAGGFRFAGLSHRGSILALPSGVHAWAPADPGQIDQASLAPLFAEPPGAVELLLVGAGATLTPISKSLREALNRASVRVEVMSTGAALSTYNVLLEEGRRVAAALLATE